MFHHFRVHILTQYWCYTLLCFQFRLRQTLWSFLLFFFGRGEFPLTYIGYICKVMANIVDSFKTYRFTTTRQPNFGLTFSFKSQLSVLVSSFSLFVSVHILKSIPIFENGSHQWITWIKVAQMVYLVRSGVRRRAFGEPSRCPFVCNNSLNWALYIYS